MVGQGWEKQRLRLKTRRQILLKCVCSQNLLAIVDKVLHQWKVSRPRELVTLTEDSRGEKINESDETWGKRRSTSTARDPTLCMLGYFFFHFSHFFFFLQCLWREWASCIGRTRNVKCWQFFTSAVLFLLTLPQYCVHEHCQSFLLPVKTLVF